MAIPDYQALMLPLLKRLADGKEHKLSKLVEELGAEFGLTEEELSERLPSGTQKVFTNRVGWARTYLKKAGLLDFPKRGFQQITERGRTVLSQEPGHIDNKFLGRFPEFVAFRNGSTGGDHEGESTKPEVPLLASKTPFEVLEDAYVQIQSTLANELRETLKKVDPKQFEQIVIDLLVSMGYGGSRADAGKAIGKTGDEGIDFLAALAIAGLIVPIKWPKTSFPLSAVTLAVALICSGLAVYIAQVGGRVRHAEFRPSETPTPASESDHQDKE
jgi:restriction system protein